MVKITDIKYVFNGQELKAPVNVTSDGRFNTSIPVEIAKKLDLRTKIIAGSLADLTKEFFAALHRYKTAETTIEQFILIRYGAAGKYSYRKDGSLMFGRQSNNNKYALSFDWSSRGIDAFGFSYLVAFKETVDTVVNWYQAEQGKDLARWEERYKQEPDKWFKGSSLSKSEVDKYKAIPFIEDAIKTLDVAQERIRAVSEMLFNFIEQDALQIADTLTKNKLLTYEGDK
jgi:hypothetical protein